MASLAKPKSKPKAKPEPNPSFIQYHLKGMVEVLKELDPQITLSKFYKSNAGTIFTVKTNSKKIFYFEEDNREVTFSYELRKKTNKQIGINIYCTFLLDKEYKYKDFDDVGKMIAEKYIDGFKELKGRFLEIIEEGEKLFASIDDPEHDDMQIYIYANFDARTAILRLAEHRITFTL